MKNRDLCFNAEFVPKKNVYFRIPFMAYFIAKCDKTNKLILCTKHFDSSNCRYLYRRI